VKYADDGADRKPNIFHLVDSALGKGDVWVVLQMKPGKSSSSRLDLYRQMQPATSFDGADKSNVDAIELFT
jgi:hypothetical protein